MFSAHSRRATVLGATALAALLAAGTAALPAQAADLKLALFVAPTVQVPTAPVTPPQFGENMFVNVGRVGTGTAHGVKISFDTTALAGIADLTFTSGSCTTANHIATCSIGELNFDKINITQNTWLSAVAGAKPGSSGKLHITLTADNAQSAGTDVTVQVGGPDFKAKDLDPQKGVKPGSTVAPVLEFANRGDLPAAKAVVEISAVAGLELKQQFSNCEYAEVPAGSADGRSWPAEQDAICTIDTTVAPGEVVKLDPIQFGIGQSALDTLADISVFSSEDAQFAQSGQWRQQLHFKRGTGAPLTVTKTQDPALLTAERKSYDNRAELEVEADNTADFAALGAWTPDSSGNQGTLTAGLQNYGPGSVLDRSGGEYAPQIQVVLPQGVTVSKAPAGCSLNGGSRGDGAYLPGAYSCSQNNSWEPAGLQQLFTFELKLPSGTDALNATVSLQNSESLYGKGHTSAVLPIDHNPANDITTVALRGPANGSIPTASATPSPTSTATAPPANLQPTGTPSAHPSAAATSPSATKAPGATGLASTGGGSHAGLIAGIGGAAVLAGAGLLVLVDRRRKAARD